MTSDQITLVRSSWVTMSGDVGALTTQFCARLCAIDDDAARLLCEADMDTQRAALAQSLAVVIRMLDDPDRLLPAINALGTRHVEFAMVHRHFDHVGEALLLSIGESLGSAFTDQLRSAWAEAYALVASAMHTLARARIRRGVADLRL